jgi:hypothetical protein
MSRFHPLPSNTFLAAKVLVAHLEAAVFPLPALRLLRLHQMEYLPAAGGLVAAAQPLPLVAALAKVVPALAES